MLSQFCEHLAKEEGAAGCSHSFVSTSLKKKELVALSASEHLAEEEGAVFSLKEHLTKEEGGLLSQLCEHLATEEGAGCSHSFVTPR